MSQMDFNAMNAPVIEEFRANAGKVGGMFEGMPMLILTTTGAKSGEQRVNPLAYLEEDGRRLVFASRAGTTRNPDWYYNLKANPKVRVEIGSDRYDATAVILEGSERDAAYAAMVSMIPQFGEYEKTAGRTIPVIALDPRN